ncbi:MAG: hypothetical protein LBG77_07360 [Dysgonamonadaceae bacterium]|jgi:hypothetical protein|nr:hypothetical protein [Dysgonamonadaceae bacterium]
MNNWAELSIEYANQRSYLDDLLQVYPTISDGIREINDFDGHQNALFADAISTIETPNVKAEKIAILDGVLYIKGNNKMYKSITETYKNHNIMSALVLRNYLYQI